MNRSEQILEDERLAIALIQAEAEQFDNFPMNDFQERTGRLSDTNSGYFLQSLEDRFNSHFDPDPFNINFRRRHHEDHPIHIPVSSPRAYNERFEESKVISNLSDFNLSSFNQGHNLDYVHDDTPDYVLEAIFENMENSRPAAVPEESKRSYFNTNQRSRDPQRAQRIDLRNSSVGSRLVNNPHRRTRGRRGLNLGHEIVEEAGNYMIDDESATYEDLMRLDDNNFNKGNGFSEAKLRNLRVLPFIARNLKNKETCSICMNEFKSAELVIKLGCGHIYHEKCIKEWLSRKKTCAVCKFEVKL